MAVEEFCNVFNQSSCDRLPVGAALQMTRKGDRDGIVRGPSGGHPLMDKDCSDRFEADHRGEQQGGDGQHVERPADGYRARILCDHEQRAGGKQYGERETSEAQCRSPVRNCRPWHVVVHILAMRFVLRCVERKPMGAAKPTWHLYGPSGFRAHRERITFRSGAEASPPDERRSARRFIQWRAEKAPRDRHSGQFRGASFDESGGTILVWARSVLLTARWRMPA